MTTTYVDSNGVLQTVEITGNPLENAIISQLQGMSNPLPPNDRGVVDKGVVVREANIISPNGVRVVPVTGGMGTAGSIDFSGSIKNTTADPIKLIFSNNIQLINQYNEEVDLTTTQRISNWSSTNFASRHPFVTSVDAKLKKLNALLYNQSRGAFVIKMIRLSTSNASFVGRTYDIYTFDGSTFTGESTDIDQNTSSESFNKDIVEIPMNMEVGSDNLFAINNEAGETLNLTFRVGRI